MVKNPPASAGDTGDVGLIPGSGRSPGEGHGNPLQYSCLENPKDRGAWWAAVHGVTKSRTRLKRLGIAQGTKQTVSADFSSDLGRNCHRGGQTPEVGRPTRSVQSILVHANGQKSECPFLTPVLGRGGESWQGQKMRQENDSDTLLMNYCCEQCNPLREQLKYGF